MKCSCNVDILCKLWYWVCHFTSNMAPLNYRQLSWSKLSALPARPLLVSYMEQSSSWKAKCFSASQEISCILWNPKVHYRINKWCKLYTYIFSFGILWQFMLMFLKTQMCKISKGFSIQFLFTDWCTLWSKYFLCTNDQVSVYWQLNVGILL